ncbi:MAG TPA: hypothetical protein VIH99_00220 [Bdellovibrionota bacterium]|jgi:hypothetical protein
MKYALILALSLGSFAAQAETLKCWNTYSKRGSKPTLVAEIVSNSKLDRFEINQNSDDNSALLKAPRGAEKGEIITSNHSPYKGNQEFSLEDARLLLPAKLDAKSLLKAHGTKGFSDDENGVIIGYGDGDGAGSHFSIRLRCRAYDR